VILLVDGNNVAYRAFHTPQGSLTTKQGEPTGVMLGFLNSLKGYLDKFPETTRVIVAWDGGKAQWRKDIYPEYKANRTYGKDDPEEKAKFEGLFKQIELLHEILPAIGVNSLKYNPKKEDGKVVKSGWEADDLIAGVCKMMDGHKMIVTSDKDMFQLVGEDVSLYNLYKDMIISPLNFFEYTGVTQNAYMGYRALLGDSSDNIDGVPGIGDKTAKSLMDLYGHIDNILAATGDTKAKLVKSKRTQVLFDPKVQAILGRNHKIMNLKYIDFSDVEEDMVKDMTTNHEVRSGDFKAFLARWQFVSILANYLPFITPFNGLGEE